MREVRWIVGLAAALGACGGGGGGGGAGGSGGWSTSCDPDPLATGLVAEQTGVSVDIVDCQILEHAAAYAWPDPMLVKAIVYGESRFDFAATACPNLPCGTPSGWSQDESYCYGMMQVVPACGGQSLGLKPDGHPNLSKDMGSSDWSTSIFNPEINVELGIAGLSGNRAQVIADFPGCTEDQYTLMAIGNYNAYGSTKSCTDINTAYVDYVLPAYLEYAAAAGYAAHGY
jgi:soluble lytic murein transglycosylase-like protein